MTGIAALGAVGLRERYVFYEVAVTQEYRCLDKGIHALPHLAPGSKSILCLDKVVKAGNHSESLGKLGVSVYKTLRIS